MKLGSLTVLLAAGLLLGCGLAEERRERREYRDEGEACVSLGADGRLAVQVVFPACLSSSCDRELMAECTVSVSDERISITSYALAEKTGALECTTDCGMLKATCQSEGEVAPGSYDFEHGVEAITSELAGAEVCFGNEL